ncbi:DNA-binding transcriptional response regulator, NtrC family, contains REC, AAA-type ATPase, and a Fis-type DNA-binding domains [Sinomicrobium oceani]|uniref:DNA-binding transcriptional response regulator, NtrC family, contains REC, AAA-type ATPase, and a Fis-type DNA-binding domains n=1 Tax=Sinomicrobium oceani TaxID=1150368 RepID=A0A1K1LQE2_9FLAO|nr:sigma-54 dependent transcriptional regulator [Sinomicrobium oceani]SFW13096.1 DNA-binding transcriptional response regulator, NtrC family, contains REC, AAA-type ATPase, and a Fis-type DNA-binding domains [Sinomicrobium oceani]
MQLKDARILVIDDDTDVLTAMRLLFKSKVKEVVTEKKPDHILSILGTSKFDVIILDMNFNGLVNTGNEGLFWLRKIREADDKTDVILITAYGDIDLAIRSLKEGASDFLVKPWKNEKILQSVQDLLDRKKVRKPAVKPLQLQGDKMLGESDVIRDVFLKLQKVAPTDANVLILGENGTGKDLIARALHENSLRKNGPFVKVDLGALTPSLFESELFGYKKGAFTDAREDRKGRFEAASGGTLFLDEIGNISLQQQARLLTVLQNRYITPLGSNETVPVDIRLICATNTEISELADESRFRKDLIYRINTVEITVPPLRERGKDIRLLASHFVRRYAEKYMKEPFTLDKTFTEKLQDYPFPGNVRELQYALERAVIMAESDVLYAADLVFSPIEKHRQPEAPRDLNLENIERNTILKVVEKNNGNISRSAKELGITRAALYRRLHKYDL